MNDNDVKVKDLLENLNSNIGEYKDKEAVLGLTIIGFKNDNDIDIISKHTATPDGIYKLLSSDGLNKIQVKLYDTFLKETEDLLKNTKTKEDKELLEKTIKDMKEDILNNNPIIAKEFR